MASSIALRHTAELTAQPRATTEPVVVRWLLISVALAFLVMFLFVPLIAVFAQAYKKVSSPTSMRSANPMRWLPSVSHC